MPKNLFQDMVKINHARRKTHKESHQEPEKELEDKLEVKRMEIKREPRGRRRHTLWFVALVAVAFFVFALSYLFTSAEVTIDPRVKDVDLKGSLSASQEASGDLSFDLIAVPGEETKVVVATAEKEVTQRARGSVIIYNAFSTGTQALDIDTRLEGSNGKLYKTEKKVVVPGMSKSGTPGSVEVKIYGAEAGESYNSGPLDFKIVGFKGTSKYAKFYARSKGDITGGFKGRAHVVSEADRAKALNELKTTLSRKLLTNAKSQIPSGFILFKDAISLDIESMDNTELLSEEESIPVKLKGTLYGILFEEEELAKKIAKNTIEKYDGSEIYISNMEDLKFTISNTSGLFKDLKSINFSLTGTAKIVWRLDDAKLLEELLGKSKKDFQQVLSQYPNVAGANLSLSPIWKRSIPEKEEDIKIIVNYP